jgi:hypothetical protein
MWNALEKALDRGLHRLSLVRERFGMWRMWTLSGWPGRCRCPQCAGSGKYSTETMARYGDEPETCGMCWGKGSINRSSPWKSV